jgi:hypothetical protein
MTVLPTNWAPGCMSTSEWATWQRANAAHLPMYAATAPCDDCEPEWASTERTAGRCNRPGVLTTDGRDPDLDSPDSAVRRRAQYRASNRRRRAGVAA